MAMRVKHVAKAQKAQGSCEVCGKPIEKGTPYKWAKGRYTAKHVRHEECADWRPSQLETGKLATAYAAQEDAHDALLALDFDSYMLEGSGPDAYAGRSETFNADVTAILETCAEGARDCASEYQEGLDNMPDGLRDGDVGMGIQEKIEILESWADELESWQNSEDWDGEEEDWVPWCEVTVQEAAERIDALEA